ncbi:hypothetical protein CERZMDRAFT_115743 [Cercospora zeae-maydis SCOH1-5]|uniref:Uncharacterized protein n=1 Tax=Cercospora zeae-maydis SCOH1-5 TaxID=717836 RepID=A0A6A6EZ44_9PEZI|nr:hypothetical protein CERZMDRAFT_115743 [Cercospora zeae-maydis SCOH1-5]
MHEDRCMLPLPTSRRMRSPPALCEQQLAGQSRARDCRDCEGTDKPKKPAARTTSAKAAPPPAEALTTTATPAERSERITSASGGTDNE